jgi:hypothetical protein
MRYIIIALLSVSVLSCNEMPQCRDRGDGKVVKIGMLSKCTATYKYCNRGKWSEDIEPSPDYEGGAECNEGSARYIPNHCGPNQHQECDDNCKWKCVRHEARSCEDIMREMMERDRE